MSGALIGGLEMQMLMDMVRWQSDVSNAGRVLDAGLEKMKASVKTAMGALGVGLSVGAFAKMIQGSIDAANAAIATVTARFKASSDSLGAAVAAGSGTPVTPPAGTP